MAIDALVDSTQLDADLTSVANAIRTKGGTSASLAFPANFVSAIAAIPSGWSADDIAQAKAPSGSVILSVPYVAGYGKDGIRDYAFYGNSAITDITITTYPNIYSYAFANMKALRSISAPLCQSMGNIGINSADSILRGCTALVTVNLPELTTIGGNMFNGCTSLVNIALPKVTTMTANSSFNGCTSLASVDFGAPTKIGGSDFFKNCSSLTALILRGSSVCALNNTGCLSGTPFASGSTGGTLYVPASLVSSYQSATNWSTILGYTNNQIKSIESTHTDPTAPIDLTLYYADGTPIT